MVNEPGFNPRTRWVDINFWPSRPGESSKSNQFHFDVLRSPEMSSTSIRLKIHISVGLLLVCFLSLARCIKNKAVKITYFITFLVFSMFRIILEIFICPQLQFACFCPENSIHHGYKPFNLCKLDIYTYISYINYSIFLWCFNILFCV